MASQDLGQLGPKDGSPVLFHWRWYYHEPALPLWALIVLLLLVPKANRHRQAWLILIPLVLVLVVWRMPTRLLSMSDGSTETLGFFVVSGALAWTMVWLLGHRLASRSRIVTFFLTAGVMLAIGLLSYYCQFEDSNDFLPLAIIFSVCVAILLLAMMITSSFCRKKYSPRRFLAWLIVWNGVVTFTLMMSYGALMMLVQPRLRDLLAFMLVAVPVTLLLAGILYLVNLPFLILAFKSPFYRERFESMFLVKKTGAELPSGSIPGDSADRPAEAADPPLPDGG